MDLSVIVRPTVFCCDLSDNADFDVASHQGETEYHNRTSDGHDECNIVSSVRRVIEFRGEAERRSDGACAV